MLRSMVVICCFLARAVAAAEIDDVKVVLQKAGGVVYAASAVNGFGGGNVAASIGPDGILLVDDMFAAVVPRLRAALDGVSTAPIRIVINSHFHGDHTEGNRVLGASAVIVAQQNAVKRLPKTFPILAFPESITIRMNGENIQVVHMSSSHTDGDAVVFFETSKVLHLGDMYFEGMFPGVYREGGGDIKHLIVSLDQVLARYPADTVVIPGHGAVGTMTTLRHYTTMLKETVAAAERGIAAGQTADAIAHDPALVKYAALGDGGAQTLDQYAAMLVKLLK